jgi:hypothetical protein
MNSVVQASVIHGRCEADWIETGVTYRGGVIAIDAHQLWETRV